MYRLHRGPFTLFSAWLFLFFVIGAAGQASPPQPQNRAVSTPAGTPPGATYVGSDVCKTCHEDVHNSLEDNPHFLLLNEKETEYHGCESCHGPGSAHVEGGGDKTKIFSFTAVSEQAASKRCLTCHGTSSTHANFDRSSHFLNGVGCINCHSIHKAKVKPALLRTAMPRLCYGCHTEVLAEFSRPFRHRVNEGLLQCTDCHNVHGSTQEKQLRVSASQDQICYKCHAEKRGPFVYEHLPVKTEGCTSCHFPHGSTNPRMLRVSNVNILCLQCHTLSPDVPSQPPIGPVHNQAQRFQACTLCHAFIHGSNFSEVFFKP